MRADATPTPIRSQKLPGALRHKHIIIACLNSVAGVNPAVLIDRAERGLRKMVKDETHDRLTSTVSFWSSIGFYSLCSSSMLLDVDTVDAPSQALYIFISLAALP